MQSMKCLTKATTKSLSVSLWAVYLGTRAAHCEIDCILSRLGIRALSPDPGELESDGGSPGLRLTPDVDETDRRLARRLPVKPVRLLERERPICTYGSGDRDRGDVVEDVDDALRCRTIACGSTSGSLARRAKMDRTSTIETTPVTLEIRAGGDGAVSSETKSL